MLIETYLLDAIKYDVWASSLDAEINVWNC